jgi:hypothetical protein
MFARHPVSTRNPPIVNLATCGVLGGITGHVVIRCARFTVTIQGQIGVVYAGASGYYGRCGPGMTSGDNRKEADRMLNFPTRLIVTLFVALATAAASGQIVVDNDDGAPGYTETGTWSNSLANGYNGGSYRFTSVGNSSTAIWTATLPTAQDYEVFVWYVPGGNRATSVKYTINAADGPHDVFINQEAGGFTFDSLGTFPFNAGSASITLDAAGSTGAAGDVVIADAVRFGADGGGGFDPPDPVEVDGAPGVWFSEWVFPTPQVNQVIEFDLADPQYTIEMGFAQAKRNFTSKEPVSVIANRYDAPGHEVIAAINASFFGPGIEINGIIGSGGNLIGTNMGQQQTYMLEQSGEGWGGSNLPAANMVAKFADGAEVPIDILDYTCASGQINLYTPDWGPSTKSSTLGAEIIVEGVNFPLRPDKWLVGKITAIRTSFFSLDNPIPPNGFVLAACAGAESEIVPHAVVGDEIAVRFDMTNRLVNLQTMVTGNVWIVKDGVPFHTGDLVRHPRTVIAWSGTRHWFVTFDGRQPGYAVGQTTAEQADFLINHLGVENAINLDGGGSTTMVVNGAVVNCPSDGASTPCTGSERADPNAMLLIKRTPTSILPRSDTFPSTGRSLPWDDKFTMNPVVAFAPAAPNGDGYAMHVQDPDGVFETCSVGKIGDVNYITEASVYCDYRPELAGDGFERVGIFARDDGNANFDATTLNRGNCYALTFDSNDGRIRAGAIVEGVFTDLLDGAPLLEPSTAWRRLRIDTIGSSIRFFVDGTQIASTTDTTHPDGRCGIAYHEYFTTNTNAQGAYVDNFSMRGLLFDTDADGDVDEADFDLFNFCIKGPKIFYPPAAFCRKLDGDNNGTVDLRDFDLFQQFYTGPL